MIKIYMAGPLFSEADQRQRKYELQLLQQEIVDKDVEVFSPINAPINDKSTLPSAEMIYIGDRDQLLSSQVVFVDLSNYDAGTMVELGMVLENKAVKVYAYDSDLRLTTTGEYDGLRVPYGTNQFVIGALLENYGNVYTSFKEALMAFCQTI